jgi:hypothetical protein
MNRDLLIHKVGGGQGVMRVRTARGQERGDEQADLHEYE